MDTPARILRARKTRFKNLVAKGAAGQKLDPREEKDLKRLGALLGTDLKIPVRTPTRDRAIERRRDSA
jgi:hypothetical protein